MTIHVSLFAQTMTFSDLPFIDQRSLLTTNNGFYPICSNVACNSSIDLSCTVSGNWQGAYLYTNAGVPTILMPTGGNAWTTNVTCVSYTGNGGGIQCWTNLSTGGTIGWGGFYVSIPVIVCTNHTPIVQILDAADASASFLGTPTDNSMTVRVVVINNIIGSPNDIDLYRIAYGGTYISIPKVSIVSATPSGANVWRTNSVATTQFIIELHGTGTITLTNGTYDFVITTDAH